MDTEAKAGANGLWIFFCLPPDRYRISSDIEQHCNRPAMSIFEYLECPDEKERHDHPVKIVSRLPESEQTRGAGEVEQKTLQIQPPITRYSTQLKRSVNPNRKEKSEHKNIVCWGSLARLEIISLEYTGLCYTLHKLWYALSNQKKQIPDRQWHSESSANQRKTGQSNSTLTCLERVWMWESPTP